MKRGQSLRLNAVRQVGFTLLELLLSLALTAVLMGAVFTALEMHWRFALTGQDDAERAQIARAVLQRMTADIRSTVYRRDKPASTTPDDTTATDPNSTTETGTSGTGTDSGTQNSSGTGSGTSPSPTKKTETVQAPTDAFEGRSLGLFGDSQTLVMHVSRPTRRLGASPVDSPFATSDLRAVSYYLAGPNGEMPTAFSTGGFSAETHGLARKNADYLSLSLTQLGTQVGTEVVGTIEMLAPEIVSLSFKYHDGFEWLTTWDSVEKSGLPVAIGVTVGFRKPQSESSFVRHRETSSSTDEFRIVVTIPTSNPFAGQAY